MRRAKSAQHRGQHRGRCNPVPPDLWLAARALMAGSLLFVLAAGTAWTQTSRPTISVAATMAAEPATQMPFVIRVGPLHALPRGSFLQVRGLPIIASLSEGHAIAPGSWAIPISALPNLKITLPVTATGRSEISFTLVAIDGSVLVEARSTLVVAAPAPKADSQAQGTAAPSPPASILRAAPLQVPERAQRVPSVPPAGSTMTSEDRERALRFVKRGDEQLADGGVAQARLLYERAAEAGLAQGAMALAATYDAAELSRLGVRGLQPDNTEARRWYERAQQLGAGEAEQRLRRLGAK